VLRGARGRLVPAGRWSLLRAGLDETPADAMRFARLALRRWGIVMRELTAREPRLPPWRTLVTALRTLEARGEVRGGRFVAGTVGEQFALPEAVEALRALRRRASGVENVVVSAADPLNLVGILVPGARIPPTSHDVIAWRDGCVAEVGELGTVLSRLRRGALGA
jgi:ATP-dependent Lhr-like helicase